MHEESEVKKKGRINCKYQLRSTSSNDYSVSLQLIAQRVIRRFLIIFKSKQIIFLRINNTDLTVMSFISFYTLAGGVGSGYSSLMKIQSCSVDL